MQQYMQPAMNAMRNPTSLFNRLSSEAGNTSPQQMLAQVRGMSNAQWASIGVVVAEVIGFFSVGEMIGRFKLVGYRSKSQDRTIVKDSGSDVPN
jgi:F-type H+-transporting ATPase subunit g